MSTREISPPILTQRQLRRLEGLSEEYEYVKQGYCPVLRGPEGKLFKVMPNGQLHRVHSESYLGLTGD